MRISDWSSDVCSSDLADLFRFHEPRRDRCCLCGRARTMAHHYRVCRRHKSDNAGKLTLEHQRFRQLLLDPLDYFIRRAETLLHEKLAHIFACGPGAFDPAISQTNTALQDRKE